MKIDDAPLTCYLVKHLQPLTEADPTLLANYVVALLKNNKPKKDLQKLCIDQLFDFLGEGTKAFVLKLFHALEDGTIAVFHEDRDPKDPIISSTVPAAVPVTVMPSGDNTESKISPQHERITGANIGVFSDGEEEGTDDEDDDRNHKHRRRVSRSRSVDRDTQDEDERAPYRKRNRPAENGQQLREHERPTLELHRGSSLLHIERDGPVKNERRLNRDHNFGATLRINGEGNQRGGSRGAPTFRGDGPGSRFEHQNGSSRGVLGRGRGAAAAVLWEQRCTPFDGADFNTGLLPSGPPPATLYSGRAIPSRGNPPHSPWAGYGHHPGIANGALDQTLPLNAGIQGPRGVSISAAMGVGVSIGIGMPLGRPRCPDFEERGYCLRGDLCPMEHGANRIVVEDVQSLSQFNLPVALPSGRGMAVGSMSVSGPSTTAFSPNLGLPSRAVRETNMASLDEASLSKGTLAANASSEPDLYDPDQPLWNREQSDVADGMRRLPSFRKGQEESEWEGGAVDRRQGRMADESNPERYGRSAPSGGSQALTPGQSVWDRIGPVDRGETKTESINRPANSSGDGLPRLKVSKKDSLEDHEPPCSRLGKWESDNDGLEENPVRASNVIAGKGHAVKSNQVEVGLRSVDGSNYSSRGGGGRSLSSGNERAQRTLYVSCIPNNNNKKELLMAHFQKFGDIMDIRIPANSDRAFVQFSHREDAEAALMSPDAVMGNRFIRLSWANRDSIQDPSGEGSMSMLSNTRSAGSVPGTGHMLVTQTSLVRGKEKAGAVSAVLESNNAESAGRLAGSNGLPSSSAVTQKKQEELEHMKEEIRRKQEELAQKRNDFRRKLDRLSKQGSGPKIEPEVDLPSNKRPKLEKSEGPSNGSNKHTSVDVPALPVTVEKNTLPVDPTAAGSVKPYSGISHPSPRGLRVPFPRPSVASTGLLSSLQWGPSRYKLDNRTTVFRILPPLPEGLLDITILKEHFSSFGELLSLEVEDGDQKCESNLTSKSVVRITFGSRRAAEHAFVQGRWFQGTSLQVVWVNPSVTPTSSKQGDGAKDSPSSCNPKVSSSGGVNKEGTEDGKSPGEQDRSIAENLPAEGNVQLSSKVADEGSPSGHSQVVASHPHSDLSTKLDSADGDSSGISKVVTSI